MVLKNEIKTVMLRSPIELCLSECRDILPFGHQGSENSVKQWTRKVVNKSPDLPVGEVFEWKRGDKSSQFQDVCREPGRGGRP